MKRSVLCVPLIAVLLISAASLVQAQTKMSVADQIIAREKASFEAWMKKDKTFFADYLADDATYYATRNPYLEVDPKVNFIPKFEMYADMFKILDYQMYNARVQVYGDVAVLTYNSSITAQMGTAPINYTAKVTVVFVKQGNVWRVVHGHESMNPGPQ